MKTHLRLFYKFLFLWLLCGTASYAQINYSEDFEEVHPWTTDENFGDADEFMCSGDWVFRGNFWNYFTPITAETISPSLGTSNGLPVTLSYSYKLIDYVTGEPVPNSPAWGSVQVQYSSSASGPWTAIESITPANHIPSANCATRTVVFTPPAGTVYLRVFCQPGTPPTEDDYIDVYLYLDNVNVIQASSVCSGTPAASTTVASLAQVCTTSPVSLSLGTSYANFGSISYQWQSSADGVAFTNVPSGGTSASYSATQQAATWYRAVITCTASTQSVTSTPVQVGTTGLPCLCNVNFVNAVEPITLVNFAGINNVTSNEVDGTPGTENFTSLAPGQVIVGQSYQITLEGNTNGDWDDYFTVFIDFNHNGDLSDTGESFNIGILSNSEGDDGIQVTGNITIPANALPGLTMMRVFKLYDEYTTDPCVALTSVWEESFGQVEDYLLNITVPCTTEAPEAPETQLFCAEAQATIADLEATATGDVVWYADETGGEPLEETEILVDGESYFAAQIDGCESEERTEVTVSIPLVLVDTLPDVVTCDEYELPAHDFGTYYTGPGGTGTMLETGTVITENTTIYIYSDSGTTPNCSAETSFMVTINSAADLDGEANQTFVEGATVADLVVISEDGAVVAWYASEEDAEEGENALEATEVLEDGIYYATQQVGGCISDPFAVTVDVTLGVAEFDNSKLVYHPNPVSNELNISYSSDITSIEIYNFLGQQVMTKAINQTDAKIDMSLLAAGTYMVKINAETGFTTVKVIKN